MNSLNARDDAARTDAAAAAFADAAVEIYDPPMCCPTGLCGPTIDPVLVEVNDMVNKLRTRGIRVERYSPSSNPGAFLNNREVYRLVREREMSALPIVTVNGRVMKVGAYPTMDEIDEALRGSDGTEPAR